VAFPLFRVEPPASLSAGESAELSARLAALAQSGLPLEGGLHALADEAARPRLARVLRNLAQRLEAGEKLESAIMAPGSRLPAHLRGLIIAGVRTGRLPIVLDQFAALSRRQQDLRRRLVLAMAYPASLLGILTAIMVFCGLYLTRQFNQVFRDFGMKLPWITEFYVHCSDTIAWTMVGLLIAALVVSLAAMSLPLGAWLGRTARWIPILGTIARDDRHYQFASLMALLLEEEIPAPEALRLTAVALEGSMLSRQSRAAAGAVEQGMPLGQALAKARFPDSLTALVAWGEQEHCPSKAFRSAAATFEARSNSQGALLNMSVPPLLYMIIVFFVGFTIVALMMPLLSLISNLSGGRSYERSAPDGDASMVFLMLGPPCAFLVGVLTLMITRLLAGPVPGEPKGAIYAVLRASAWTLTIVGFLAGTELVVPGLVILLPASLAVVFSMAYSKNVANQQYAMLALVGAAAERSMPLETAFAAFGRERGGWMRKRSTEIASRLHEGASLPAALEDVPGVLPPEAVPLVCVGYENGSLQSAIEQAITARNAYEPVWQSILSKICYVCILPPVALGILAFIMLKIMPQFQKIFKDFGASLPVITRDLIAVCQCTWLWPSLGIIWLFAAGLLIYGILRYAGSIRWELPGMDRLLRRWHVASVLDAVALAAERRQPLREALATLASTYPHRTVQRRLCDVCDDLDGGGDDLQSLHRHGLLGQTDLVLLQSAGRNGNVEWAAREMADSNRRRFIYRTCAIVQVIFPLIIAMYGVAIAGVASAVIFPLAELIGSLHH